MDTYTEWTHTSAAYAAYRAASERAAQAFAPVPATTSTYLAPTTLVDFTDAYAASDDRFPASGWMVEKESGIDEYTVVQGHLVLCGVPRSALVSVA